jgi:O-antigen/teichoic acid export membrane protein
MSFLDDLLSGWRTDNVFRRVLGSSSVLLSSNSISLGLSVLQSVLAGRLLGAAGFGLVGIVMAYSSTVNGLLSFRMSELVVRYGGEHLEKGENARVASLVKVAALGEASVSVIAFLFVLLTSSLAATYLSKSPETTWLFTVYAVGLLANFNIETSTGVLQILGRIKMQGVIHLVQSVVTAMMILYAFIIQGSVYLVLVAYVAGKIIQGLGLFLIAWYSLTQRIGVGWWRRAIGEVPNLKELLRFGLSSNLSATVILIFRESEILWVGFFLNQQAAGIFKAAYSIVSLLSVPANPLILSTYPEINNLVVMKSWRRLLDFLRKITSLAALYNLLIAAGFIVFGRWLLSIYGEQYTAGYFALLAMLAGLLFNYIFFWNRPLLLALGKPGYPLKATLAAGLFKSAMAFAFVPRYGIAAEATLLSCYYIISVGAIVIRGVQEIRSRLNLNSNPDETAEAIG